MMLLLALTLFLLAAWPMAAATASAAEPGRSLAIMKQRYRDDALARPVDVDRVDELLRTLGADGRWPGINYEDLSRTGFEHRRHLSHLIDLARACVKADSPRRGDEALRQAIDQALGLWLEHDFICDNWWHNEIGTPRQMATILLLLDDELSDDQRERGLAVASRANLEGFGARPGGDLVQIAEIMVQRGLAAGDTRVIEQALAGMLDELRITTGRGMQPDHSFHHRVDGVIQTTAYGQGYSRAVIAYGIKARGTIFALPEDRIDLLVDHQLEGLRWTLAHGSHPPPTALNRQITRPGATRPVDADVVRDLLTLTTHRQEELRALLEARQGQRPVAWSGHRFYWRSAYLAHQRPGFHASVRMYSSRNHSTEGTFNHEGLKNHHLADGAHAIIQAGGEFDGVFPAWDWQKVPGTTVLQKPALPGRDDVKQPGQTAFVGGVTDGQHGAAAMDFKSPHDPLVARKAWFFFDRAFVMLGAGIRAGGDGPVATTLNQTRLAGDVTVASAHDEAARVLEPGTHPLADVAWVHHDDVGYLITEPAAVNMANGPTHGSWRSINEQSWASDEPVTVPMFKLWLDHGQCPSDASYACIIAPGVTAAEVPDLRASLKLTILANTPTLQAVHDDALGQTQIVFYEPGELELTAGLTLVAAQPCLAMVTRAGQAIERITVADPTQERLSLSLSVTAALPGAAEAWDAAAGRSELHFELPVGGEAGRSVTRRFAGADDD